MEDNKTLLKLYSQSNYMVVNRDLAKKIGLTQAIVFGQLCSLQDTMGEWFFFTQDKLAEACCISVATIKRSLTELRTLGYIQTIRKGNPCKTLYSIQWSNLIAQNELTSKVKMSQQDSSKRANIINNNQSNNKTINKNTKEKPFESIFNNMEASELLKNTLLDFIEFRTKTKAPLTQKALELMLKKLDSIAGNEQEKIEIINQSIMNGWKGIFPLNNKSNPSSPKIFGKGKEQEYLDSIGEW